MLAYDSGNMRANGEEGADGFNIMSPWLPGGLSEFAELVEILPCHCFNFLLKLPSKLRRCAGRCICMRPQKQETETK